MAGHDPRRSTAPARSRRASTPTSTRSCSIRQNPAIAFVGSDGGVVRVDVRAPGDNVLAVRPAALRLRRRPAAARARRPGRLPAPAERHPEPRSTPLNDGLNTIQFQSLSVNPSDPKRRAARRHPGQRHVLLHRGNPTWFEVVGGDGGQSGFDPDDGSIRYHNYYDATPEVNFHSNDPKQWLAIYDPLQLAGGALVLHAVHRRPERRRPRVHRDGARLAHRRQRRLRGLPRGTHCNTLLPRPQPARAATGSRSART